MTMINTLINILVGLFAIYSIMFTIGELSFRRKQLSQTELPKVNNQQQTRFKKFLTPNTIERLNTMGNQQVQKEPEA